MDSNFLQIYLDQNLLLARTIVIKSNVTAELINKKLSLDYPSDNIDLEDKTSWKYYLNISGEYHHRDKTMTVISLDTLEEIIFNKENLEVHNNTKIAYQFGTRYYYSLLNRYPDQEQLILGIIYPVDIDEAIEAETGKILGYPTGLVEEQEITLIEELNTYNKNYFNRWDIPSFNMSDDLYAAAQLAIFYLNFLVKLLNLRLKRAKTNEAHSFHIREYLASHSKLDRYIDYMTLKQKLFLYRNILYINNNAGKVNTFNLLVNRLLAERQIPLSEFSVRQLADFDEQFYPILSVRKKAISSQFNMPEKDFFTIEDLFNKEKKLVYGNDSYQLSKQQSITNTLLNSDTSVLQSKDLESYMIDYTDAIPDPLEIVLLRQWAYMSSKNLYHSIILFKDGKTFETKTLNAKDAFIYFYYLNLCAAGLTIETIPDYINIKQRKRVVPNISEFMSVVDSRFKRVESYAYEIKLEQDYLNECVSTKVFYNQTYKIYDLAHKYWHISSSFNDAYEKASYDNMIYMLYEDEFLELGNGNMTQWLTDRNLPAYDYSNSQAADTMRNLFIAATGLNIDDTKLMKNVQRAMVEAFKQLSSYSIQLMYEINQSRINILNWRTIRLADMKKSLDHYDKIKENVRVIDMAADASKTFLIDHLTDKDFNKVEQTVESAFIVSSELSCVSDVEDSREFTFTFPRYHVVADYAGFDINVSNESGFIGMENYLLLTDNQKSQLKSIY